MSDLTNATRELFVRSLKPQVLMKTPFFEALSKRNKITFKGGRYIEELVDIAEMDDLGQWYEENEQLTDQKKTMLDKPRFTWKNLQIPLRYGLDEEIQNIHAGNEIQLLNLANFLVKKGQRAAKLLLMKAAFNEGSTTGVSDGQKKFQSLVSGLDHDVTYGTKSRSWSGGTNDWWQGADSAGLNEVVTSSSQATAYNLTLSNVRKWISETSVTQNMEGDDDLYIMCCPTLYNKLRSEMESRVIYQPDTEAQKQGFKKMWFDGHQIASIPYLQTTTTMKKWFFIVNLNDWELRIHTRRNFKMTDFKWQGDQANGFDYWLARILIVGNLVCWKPNGSLWLSNVT